MLLTYVVPKIVTQFEHSKAELPLLTQVLIAFSDFMRDWGRLVLPILILGAIAFVRWLRDPAARRRFHAFLLRRAADRQSGPRQQHGALRAHVLDADLERGARARSDAHLRRSRDEPADARRSARRGHSRARGRADRPLAGRLETLPADDDSPDLDAAKRSGDIETMLDRAATNQEREMDSILGAVVGLLGPLMILVMGGSRTADRASDAAADLPAQSAHCLKRARVAPKSLLRDGTRPLI